MKKKQTLLPIISALAVASVMAELFFVLMHTQNPYWHPVGVIPLLIFSLFINVAGAGVRQYIQDRRKK